MINNNNNDGNNNNNNNNNNNYNGKNKVSVTKDTYFDFDGVSSYVIFKEFVQYLLNYKCHRLRRPDLEKFLQILSMKEKISTHQQPA